MRGTWKTQAMLTAAILALAPIAASSEESITQLDRRDPTIEVIRRPEICTEQFDPVCARIEDEYRIYSNACFARAAGAHIVNDGSCHLGHHSRPLA